jgi:hypothetical protein
MNRLTYPAAGLGLILGTMHAPAQDPKPGGEDEAIRTVVAASMEAGRKSDWNAYAQLVYPESLNDYKKMWLPILRTTAKQGPQKQADLLTYFAQAKDIQSLIDMSPKEFFVSSMKGVSSQFRAPAPNPLHVREKIIGTVREGDDLAYVVVRTQSASLKTMPPKVEVVQLKQSGREWKILLPEVIRVMADMIPRMLNNEPQQSGPVTDRPKPDK